ncbi:MAG: 3-hydroxyanthranilate 3,4-dioxygenase [Bdellovibrionaceae bacterium]|nr:3-hydroxyanthranilate 3,4-dioxygenase [Pseudobdellovibrionaceae bacterium]|tara:strand:- start:160218 stop:160736 length:519 start_codon:yes stop_codon:yes gene_type:complete
MQKLSPLNFSKWIDDHRDLLKPPVGNKMVWEDRDFICMVVGGPNSRTDYHVNQTEEFFHQIEGEMILKMVSPDGEFYDMPIKAGEIFLLPPNTPHSPQRMANSVGLVIERKRPEDMMDKLQWYCKECHNKLYEEEFHLKNIETAFGPVFERYFGKPENYTCSECGTVNGKDV